MKRTQPLALLASVSGLLALLAVACGPAAEATPATATQPTATTASGNPTTTTGSQATATTGAAPTTTVVSQGTAGPKDRGAIQPVAVAARPAPNPAAQKGGILRRVVTNYPPDWTQWETTNAATSVASTPLHDWLVQWNSWEKDKRNQIVPNLAYDWWLSQDGLTWTLKLVKGAKFHDGSEMTCTDVKFMIESIRNGQDSTGSELRSSPRGQYIKRVKNVTCADNYTVLVDTDGPLPSLLSSLASGNFSIYPKAVFEGHIRDMVDKEGPAMGPFTVTQKVAGETVTYKRNANYWDQPYPYLDGYELNNLGSATAVYSAFRVGRAELGTVPNGQYQGEIDRKFFSVQGGSRAGGYFIDINAQRQPWGDPKVRMAMRCAFDSDAYVKTGFNGFARADLGVWPTDSPWALSAADVAKADPCLDKNVPLAQRQARGRQLMEQAGYGPNARLSADMLIRGSTFVYDPVITDLATVYIDAKPRIVEVAAAYKAAYAGEFDFHPSGFITSNKDPDQWLFEHYYSKSDRNYGKYTSPEVDALLDQQSKTVDPAKRLEIVKQINTILSRETGKLIMAHYDQPAFSAPWLMDWYFVDPSIASPSEQFTRVWIDQAKLKAQGG